MTITIHLPSVLRGCCNGTSEVRLSAETVRNALEQIEKHHPELYQSVCDETGAVRRHINVFVNNDHMRERDGLNTALAGGDVLTLLPAVSGGSRLPEKGDRHLADSEPAPFFGGG